MANKHYKVPENSTGHFFVDKSCIICDSCTNIATPFFALQKKKSYAYVENQPENKQDIERCFSALKACPVAAIGYDKHDTLHR